MLKSSSSFEGVKSEETTIISSGVKIEGKIFSNGNIRVDGQIKGDISCQNNVTVGEEGQVNGQINANAITIGGNVVGSVNAKDKLALESKGYLKGDVFAKVLVVEAGAKIDGNIKMGDVKPAPEIKEIKTP